jgi:hypothetical protein
MLEKLRIRAEQPQKDKPTQTGEAVHAREIVKIIVQGSTKFIITHEMMFIDEDETQRPLKEIETLELALPKISMKALYKLEISVMQEI